MSKAISHVVPSGMMSGPELYATLASGYIPVGMVVGVSARSMGTQGFGRSIRSLFKKGEMSAISQTSADARREAIAQAEQAAKELGADLFIISHLEVLNFGAVDEVTCMGTALKKTEKGFCAMPMATASS